MPGITGPGVPEMLALAERLAGADRALRADLRARWRAAAGPAADEVRKAIATAGPVRYERGLRAETAATVSVSTRLPASNQVAVAIVSDGSKMPPGKSNLPKAMDKGGWRHPVYGRRKTWVGQLSVKPGWFTLTCYAQGPAFREAAARVLDDMARELGG